MFHRMQFNNKRSLSRRLFTGFVSCSMALAVTSAYADAPEAEQTVQAEMFRAMDEGDIEVKFIPLNTTKANVIIKNLTDKPMTLQLPAAFAGVPINAQMGMGGMGGMGGGGMGGGGMGGGGMGGGGQGMGGGMGGMGGGGMGGGGMGGGGMGGFMRIAPNKQSKLSVKTVCLEHGKPDPTPKMAYKIIPLENFTSDERVKVLCEALGYNQVAQNTAQAAAWNLTDDLSWEKLSSLNKVESKYLGNIRWFSPLELRQAMVVVSEATRIAKSRSESSESESESSDSLSSDS
ncbi:MAG: hypothetical protein AAFV88_17765 [Planctomycetota bacterium]